MRASCVAIIALVLLNSPVALGFENGHSDVDKPAIRCGDSPMKADSSTEELSRASGTSTTRAGSGR